MKATENSKLTNMNNRKRLAFRLIAMSLPFLAIFLLELVLRIFHYGHDVSLFVEDQSCSGCLVFNRYASLRFFNDEANSTMGDFEAFPKEKLPGTKRIFVLGESTTLGYPYMHNGSFHRWLRYRLLQEYPDQDFEIINLSLTGVNSFTVLSFARELPRYQPDAVLIYCGHNEYYGALGGASTSSVGSNRSFILVTMFLKKYRTVQLFFNTFSFFKHHIFGNPVNIDQTLMERMAANKRIAFGSPAYTAGIQQFRDNISEVCAQLTQRKIPVFLSTVVSNELSMRPFVSDPLKSNALSLYRQGIAAYMKTDFVQAKRLFVQAKEEDMLRFRAPEAINRIIAALPTQYPLVHVVDSRKFFEKNSSHGIIDSTTLLEHVHPNLRGYALISDAFYRQLRSAQIVTGKPEKEISMDELRHEMPVTVVDSLFGELSIAMLKCRWPFNQPNTAVRSPETLEGKLAMGLAEQKGEWNDAMDQLMTYYEQSKNTPGMLKVAEAVMLEYPHDAKFYTMAGRIAFTAKDNHKAANYLGRAFRLAPNIELAQQLFIIYLKEDRPELALSYVRYGIRQASKSAALISLENKLTEIVRLKANLTGKNQPAIRRQIAASYRSIGNEEVARSYEQ